MSNNDKIYESKDGRDCYCNNLPADQSVETMLSGHIESFDGIGNMYIEIAPVSVCSTPNKIFKIR